MPPAPSQSIICCSSQIYGDAEDIFDEEVLNYAAFCRKVLRPGEYAITFTGFYMVGERIVAITLSGFVAMPHRYTFNYCPKTVSKRCVAGFPKNIVQYAVLARFVSVYPSGY